LNETKNDWCLFVFVTPCVRTLCVYLHLHVSTIRPIFFVVLLVWLQEILLEQIYDVYCKRIMTNPILVAAVFIICVVIVVTAYFLFSSSGDEDVPVPFVPNQQTDNDDGSGISSSSPHQISGTGDGDDFYTRLIWRWVT